VKQTSVTIFLGLLVALPLIFILEPRGAGAIGLIWLISSGLVAVISLIINRNKKKAP
jgi:hypothetical protein